ncbi:Protein of unknown function [Lactobacillus helveticus CIRM-BIA 101]
MRKNN